MLHTVQDIERLRAQRDAQHPRRLDDRKASLPGAQAAPHPAATLLQALAGAKGRARTEALRTFWSELPRADLQDAAKQVLGSSLEDAVKVLWVGQAPLDTLDASALKHLAAAVRASHKHWGDTTCLGQALATLYRKGGSRLDYGSLINERLELQESLAGAKGLWRWVEPYLPTIKTPKRRGMR